VGSRNAEVGRGEFGSGNLEVGMRKSEVGKLEFGRGKLECGSGTRRRPVKRDFDAARCGSRKRKIGIVKSEGGNWNLEGGKWKGEKDEGGKMRR
jgi:hypothetical protein